MVRLKVFTQFYSSISVCLNTYYVKFIILTAKFRTVIFVIVNEDLGNI
jgi:hypothetical protein